MPFKSPFPSLDIPKVDILSYLFPDNEPPSETPIWFDSENPEHHLSPKELLQWVKRLAVGLNRLGVKRGEVVMIFTPNHIFVPVAYLGIVGSGRIFSGANSIYTVAEIAYQIRNTEARVLLVHPSLIKLAVAASREAGLPQDRVFQFSDTPNSLLDGIKDWRSMIGSNAEGAGYTWPRMSEEESLRTVATINYSSGTTGLPKGVCVSHHNLIANVEQSIFTKSLNKANGTESDLPERWVGFLPLYHAYGQLHIVLLAAKIRIPVYVMKQFVFEDLLRIIQTQKVTHLHVAPPIIVMLAKRPETANYDLSSLIRIVSGAAPLSRQLQNEVANRLRVKILQGWGMTELTCTGISTPATIDDDTGTVGFLVPNCECKLLDDDGTEVPTGEPGEIYIRGPNVCLGYWKNDAATRDTLSSDGWLKTGDVAIVRDNGFWIVDRKKELIKVNALQVAPAELEAVLLENDDVADAAVVGVTLHDEEAPRAYVALKDHARGKVSPDQIQSWMQDKVAKHKRLTGGVSFVNEIPKSASGKIQRKIMREWAKRDAPALEGTIKARL